MRASFRLLGKIIHMPDLLINQTIQIPEAEFHWTSVRSQGPGGQNVNKVNTKVVLRWNVLETQAIPPRARDRLIQRAGSLVTQDGWLIVTSQQGRRRSDNLQDCFDKLRSLVLASLREPKVRRATRPTAASERRRRKTKEEVARKKQQRRPPSAD